MDDHPPARAEHRGGVSPHPTSWASVVGLAVLFGVMTGWAELVLLAVRKVAYHKSLLLSPHIIWMTPVASVLLFALAGLAVGALVAVLPGQTRRRVAIFLLAALASTSVMVMLTRLYPLAKLLLGLGIALTVTRVLVARPSLERAMRRVGMFLAALTVVLGAVLTLSELTARRRAMDALGPAAAGAPNILLIIWDTVRAASMSAYGYDRPTTPILDSLLADGRGVRFDWAIAPSPWTLPSHATMFTGRFTHEMTADLRTPLDDRFPTIGEILQSMGYVTAGFAGNTFYCGFEFGLGRGFTHYEDYLVSLEELPLSSALGRWLITNNRLRARLGWHDIYARRTAPEISRSFLDWLSVHSDRPFFAFLNYFDAHEPYLPPLAFRTRYGPQEARALGAIDHRQLRNGTRWGRRRMTAAEQQAEHDAYDGAVSYLDHQFGLLYDELDRRGVLDNTIIILTSDHGEQFGEHDIFVHGNSLYTQLLHVPLIVFGPDGVVRAKDVPEPVSLRDLPATILDLAGGREASPPPPPLPGRSLVPRWMGEREGSAVGDTILAEFEEEHLRSLVTENFHYIVSDSGVEELYDLKADPFETVDLASTSKGRDRVARIREAYRALLAVPWSRERVRPPLVR